MTLHTSAAADGRGVGPSAAKPAIRKTPGLRAVGSHAPAVQHDGPELSWRIRMWLIVEMAALYVGAPFAISWAIVTFQRPLFEVMQPILLAFVIFLLWDKRFRMRTELTRGFPWGQLARILATFVVVGGAITVATYYIYPNRFLGFPRYVPRLWVLIMVFYPLLSVIAQELVYRTFFFHRYGALFGDRPWLAIVLNGVVFGFGHVMFDNTIAIVGSAGLGMLLAYRYLATRSFWAVWFEHSLYGWLVFTVGLGHYFYTGVSNMN